ncbi:hypothetical protein AGMMS49936_06740 [Endomicrobiia bacterium]|nr:hypothetical protein AGMMS49936_06740 [Endomicrobiia bacterium]
MVLRESERSYRRVAVVLLQLLLEVVMMVLVALVVVMEVDVYFLHLVVEVQVLNALLVVV